MGIVSTLGPRGYYPKYGINESGQKVELYSGPLLIDPDAQKKYKWRERFNVDFLNISRDDEPDLLTGEDSYTGTTESERITWLTEQMRRLQIAYGMYLQKVQEMAKTETSLAASVGTVLTATATGLIKTNPAAALFIGVPGVLVKFLSSANGKKLQAFKVQKITEWAAIMSGMEQQYETYKEELEGYQSKRTLLAVVSAGGLAYLLYKFSKQ